MIDGMKYFLFFFFCLILILNGNAQNDTLTVKINPEKSFLKKQVLPVSFIATGTALSFGTLKRDIQDQFPNTNTKVDNILQFAPMAQMYAFDLMGIKHKNSVFDQTKYLVISQAASVLAVQSLKRITKVERPSGVRTSFPSGHTTCAFVGATMLYKEFKDTDPLLAYSGFAVAATTGLLRITNDKHWLSDVVAGAGIGILTVNLVYHFKPLKNWQPFKKNKNFSITPVLTPYSASVNIMF